MSEPSPAGDPLLVESYGDRVVATLHRPHKRNAIDQATIDALHALCAELEAAPRPLILTGAGGVFAAGADIAELRERRAADALRGINAHAFIRLAELPMPVIAAIDGYALGGGAELAYAADIRIATPSIAIGNPDQIIRELKKWEATGVDRETAKNTISLANGSVKTAITMILAHCDLAEATRRLEQARGHIRQAIM